MKKKGLYPFSLSRQMGGNMHTNARQETVMMHGLNLCINDEVFLNWITKWLEASFRISHLSNQAQTLVVFLSQPHRSPDPSVVLEKHFLPVDSGEGSGFVFSQLQQAHININTANRDCAKFAFIHETKGLYIDSCKLQGDSLPTTESLKIFTNSNFSSYYNTWLLPHHKG